MRNACGNKLGLFGVSCHSSYLETLVQTKGSAPQNINTSREREEIDISRATQTSQFQLKLIINVSFEKHFPRTHPGKKKEKKKRIFKTVNTNVRGATTLSSSKTKNFRTGTIQALHPLDTQNALLSKHLHHTSMCQSMQRQRQVPLRWSSCRRLNESGMQSTAAMNGGCAA